MLRACAVIIVAAGALSSASCSKPVDLKQALQITDVRAGYFDAGIVDGRNKIVPSVTFRLKKATADSVTPLSVNIAFKQLPKPGTTPAPGQPAENDFDEVFKQSVPFSGDQSELMTVRATAGYTGDPPQSRADLLKHSQFQDMRVHLFAKHSASQWVEIATIDVPRQLIVP